MQGLRTELTSSVKTCVLQAVGRSNICTYHKNLARLTVKHVCPPMQVMFWHLSQCQMVTYVTTLKAGSM